MNSRNKGKRGELELAEFLRLHGFEARRGQQFHGGAGSPDVVTNVPGVHFECKRVEKFQLEPAMAQAVADAGANTPVVAHRKNRGEWLAILRLEDFLSLVRVHGNG